MNNAPILWVQYFKTYDIVNCWVWRLIIKTSNFPILWKLFVVRYFVCQGWCLDAEYFVPVDRGFLGLHPQEERYRTSFQVFNSCLWCSEDFLINEDFLIKQICKWTWNVISSHRPFIERHVWFPTVPLKAVSDQEWIRYLFFSFWNSKLFYWGSLKSGLWVSAFTCNGTSSMSEKKTHAS